MCGLEHQAVTTVDDTTARVVDDPSLERVSHLYPNDCYVAHLSLYDFAVRFATGSTVLDLGCGTGYGSAYLADHGAAAVEAVDISAEAIAFCRSHFQRPNLRFQPLDLQTAGTAFPGRFDLVFTSNVLEHVADLPATLDAICQLLTPDGAVVVAVPPIVSLAAQAENVANLYHVNIWSPLQWQQTFARYFGVVTAFGHQLSEPGRQLDTNNTPAQTDIDVTSFVFEPLLDDELLARPTLTSLFILRQPLPAEVRPALGHPPRLVDDSFSIPPGATAERTAAARRLLDTARATQAHLSRFALRDDERELWRLQRRVQELEAIIATKNRHIGALEDLLRRIEAGRLLRLMRWLGGRPRPEPNRSTGRRLGAGGDQPA